MLVSLGLGGAWVSNLTVLEPFRPWFLGAALVALFFAYWRIFRPVATCEPGAACAVPATRGMALSGAAVAAMKTVILAVENMTCAVCPITVKKALNGVAGVSRTEVSSSSWKPQRYTMN